MTTNLAAGNPPVDDAPSNSKYRLWRTFPISPGNPNTILVHGAVVPLLADYALYEPDKRNNKKLCSFQNLSTLLHGTCGHNVWEFEYADTCDYVPFLGVRCVNYGSLTNYSNELIEAIRKVQNLNSGSPVNIIAHSMGGLIARCAAQKMGNGVVKRIITLDTGHLGFELAVLFDKILIDQLPPSLQTPVLCAEDAKPKSDFMQALTEGFTLGKPELVSLAAGDETPFPPPCEIPLISVRVVNWTSSSMGQVDDNGNPTPSNYNIPFYILPNCNHLSIVNFAQSSLISPLPNPP
jgi:pimeloyl-ACP methyl ester carboxylesterase